VRWRLVGCARDVRTALFVRQEVYGDARSRAPGIGALRCRGASTTRADPYHLGSCLAPASYRGGDRQGDLAAVVGQCLGPALSHARPKPEQLTLSAREVEANVPAPP